MRVRALSSGGVSPRRHPLPNPPPQAGEGAEWSVRSEAASNITLTATRPAECPLPSRPPAPYW
ncbi:hypothetical protein C7U65_31860 [Bradyrhizobium sp. WBAH23]|nr:hypothetical protein [Bradyrhizobium sp. WBAH30]MDD1544134.1 hypothetical protein [Bradyrhizobium sp. WBAH41]MDD1560155.1 hypothetical protein [Bradyrhizobium sp. WBAH23]MDD1566640.1 hypothetical protein [Bradyrhizobium sp. WBAH33]MDD1593655.1 hypothetical protein [Bradyrhizobium sp. WBAH42]NRB89092.1 hypothetical protein [Bradyrhizobium sp. WBAH10]